MIRILTIFILALNLFGNSQVDIKEKKDILNIKNSYGYSIQIYTSKALPPALKFIKTTPLKIQKDSFIVKIGNYYVVRYLFKPSFIQVKKFLEDVKNIGFQDAFIVKMTKEKIIKSIKLKKIKKNINKKPVDYATILSKADRYFEQGKYQKSLNEYLKLYNQNKKTDIMLINISYLMGRTKNIKNFQNLLKSEDEKEIPLYAFGIGSIEIDEDIIAKDILIKNLKYSQEGYLDLLLGYIYEKNGDILKALNFYKNAYLKNSKNIYFIYAYARALDIQKKYQKAYKYYKKILEYADNKKNNNIIIYTKKRVEQLRK